MSNSALLNTDALAEWLGYSQPASVRKWLEANGIAYMTGKDGLPVTTLELVTRAIEDQAPSAKDGDFVFTNDG